MALKDIFKMTKANRYTADGREELIKAQEAETEDRRYNIGEISEKTGLQKTANGWVKPKKGNAAGANQEEKTVAKESKPAAENKTTIRQGTTNGDKWQKNTDYLGRERISMETPQGGKVSIYESDNPKQKNARFRVDTGSHYNEFNTLEEAKAFAEEHYGRESKSESKPESKPAAEESEFSANDLPEVGQKVTFNWKDKGKTGIKGTVLGFKTINGKTYARVRGEDKSLSPTGEFNVNLQSLKSEGPRLNTNKGKTITGNIEQENGIWEPIYGEPADSAPRILTGDTRIRVRK